MLLQLSQVWILHIKKWWKYVSLDSKTYTNDWLGRIFFKLWNYELYLECKAWLVTLVKIYLSRTLLNIFHIMAVFLTKSTIFICGYLLSDQNAIHVAAFRFKTSFFPHLLVYHIFRHWVKLSNYCLLLSRHRVLPKALECMYVLVAESCLTILFIKAFMMC